METIEIEIDLQGREITTVNRDEITRRVDEALRESGLGSWSGCRWLSGRVVVFVTTGDPEATRDVIDQLLGKPINSL
jgi:hypothetical protein